MLGCGGAGLAGVQQNSYEKNTPITGVCAKRENAVVCVRTTKKKLPKRNYQEIISYPSSVTTT